MAKKKLERVLRKVVITVSDTDIDKGQVNIVAEFEPSLSKGQASTPAVELAMKMLYSIKSAGSISKSRVVGASGAVTDLEL